MVLFSKMIQKGTDPFCIILVLLLLVGEVRVLDVFNVVTYCAGDGLVEVGVTTQEPGAEIVVHAQHIGAYKNLTVNSVSCTDAYNRN